MPSLNLPFKIVLMADSNKNFFISISIKLNNGGCSILVVRSVVVSELASGNLFSLNNERTREFREKGVRFSSSTLSEAKEWQSNSVSAFITLKLGQNEKFINSNFNR